MVERRRAGVVARNRGGRMRRRMMTGYFFTRGLGGARGKNNHLTTGTREA